MHYQMFDPRLVGLMDEIMKHHPHIIWLCSHAQDKDFYMQLQEVSAAVGIVLDGAYGAEDVYEICEKLTKHLYNARQVVIMPLSAETIVASPKLITGENDGQSTSTD